ncbi:MAG: 2-dehydro-3-deoxygalactonokinase [Cocleimonas sp.]|jgi:2-dehydro-3-deoxygalactonokinase
MPKKNELHAANHYFVAVDWGTTNFRAYLIDNQGLCIDSVSNNDGVIKSKNNFEVILQQHIGHWLNSHGPIMVILSGMVGSQIGWLETPYTDCPISIESYSDHLVQIPSFNHGNCWLVPGAKYISNSGITDVMRGEELQVIGTYQLNGTNKNGLFCCPGTHNKWVYITQGQIDMISTSMTGEMFSLLHEHSILKHSFTELTDWHLEAFLSGLKHSQVSGGLLNHLFSVRTNYITGKHAKNEGSSYLSGLLIGHDIQSTITTKYKNLDVPISIIGSSRLCESYSIALTYFNHLNICIPAQSSVIAGANYILQKIKEKR